MRKLFILTAFVVLSTVASMAQKYALVDMEYILKNIPAYDMANEQLNQISKKWQTEVENQFNESKAMYKKYQSDLVFLSDEMKVKREEEIVAKEKAAIELQRKYFGPEGELYKKREILIAPIQDDVYNAVKAVAEERGYSMILDRASSQNIIFASPRIDVSNEVLGKLGISK
ncbi:MAG: OmpH family outer membrane protein [Bacteroidales bacterium]